VLSVSVLSPVFSRSGAVRMCSIKRSEPAMYFACASGLKIVWMKAPLHRMHRSAGAALQAGGPARLCRVEHASWSSLASAGRRACDRFACLRCALPSGLHAIIVTQKLWRVRLSQNRNPSAAERRSSPRRDRGTLVIPGQCRHRATGTRSVSWPRSSFPAARVWSAPYVLLCACDMRSCPD
jgi:hypothetical protein